MLCIKLHPPNIENAPPLNRSCTPSEPKLHPLTRFLSKLESFANLIAGRTLEQFGEKIIRSAKILHIRVGFSFIIYRAPAAAPQGRDTHDVRR